MQVNTEFYSCKIVEELSSSCNGTSSNSVHYDPILIIVAGC